VSLTGRILFSFALMALAAFACLLNPILDRVERQYLEATEEPMVDAAEILAGLVSSQLTHKLAPPNAWQSGMISVKARPLHARIYNLMKDRVLMDFYIADQTGQIVYDSGEVARVGDDFSIYRDVSLTLMGEYGARSTRLDESDSTSSIMFVGAPIIQGDEIIGVLSVYKPQRSMLLFIQETKQRFILLGLGTLTLVLLLGWFLSRWVTQPLRQLTAYAAAVSRGERPDAPKMPGHNLRVLGENTEAMREALENRKYVESYVQSLTHEMKSPVAGIRGAAELLEEELTAEKRALFLGNIQSETLRLQNLVDQLLALSSLENRKTLGEPVVLSLSALVRCVVNHCQSNTMQKQIVFEVVECPQDEVLGEAFLLETAISNLLQNAIDFSPTGSRIQLSVTSTDESVTLTIEDSGSGIPDYALNRIFDRFYSLPRPGSERKSSGLGLCFVHEAVLLHAGSLSISNRRGVDGVHASITLPKQAD
jgi:two-component system sensor histidine kinase CreC